MSNVLSQAEVDSLLSGVTTGEIETETDAPAPADGAATYDFSSHSQKPQARVPALDVVNNTFVAVFRTRLSNMVRKEVDVVAGPLDVVKFEDFHGSLPVPTCLHIFRMEPLSGQALLVFESRLVFSLIECYFGGRGKEQAKVEGRDFTPIENSMIRKVVNVCLEDLGTAWDRIHKIRMTYIRSEINPQFATIMPMNDWVMVIRFNVDMEGIGGQLTLCMPFSSLDPIRPLLEGGISAQSGVDKAWIRRLKRQVRNAPVGMVVHLGSAQITTERLIGLRVGDVVQLDQDVSDCLIAEIAGRPKLKVRPGVVKGNRAVRVEGLLNRSQT